jgi:hypothetical protein
LIWSIHFLSNFVTKYSKCVYFLFFMFFCSVYILFLLLDL